MVAIQPNYKGLPFFWRGKSPETIENDKRWLESIVRNAAPFSDWWTKARIVQLAYRPDNTSERQTYLGLASEAAIAQAIRKMCNLELHIGFAAAVDEEYVVKTLNSWYDNRFPSAVARNFEVYADRQYENVFLVTSTATVTLDVDRLLPPPQRFRALFNVNELAWIMRDRPCHRMTLRTHGYASPAKLFFQNFATEARVLNRVTLAQEHAQPLQGAIHELPLQHFYIGYQWPSEQPLFGRELWFDFRHNLGISFKFLFVLSGVAGVAGTILYALLKVLGIPLLKVIWNSSSSHDMWTWGKSNIAAATQFNWLGIVGTVFLLWGLLFQMLRILAYQRDRNRAVNYGSPDLAEFFWRLDEALGEPSYWSKHKAMTAEAERFKHYTLAVNLIGHSMGALVMVTLLRILSDRFGKDNRGKVLPDFMPVATHTGKNLIPRGGDDGDRIGQYLKLDKLILASPDIPLEFIREGRNNYVRSAISRCRQLYLMSSDRDIVLRYLSTIANWFSEPSIAMSGLRLGNVFLQPRLKTETPPQYHPVLRNLIGWRSAATGTSAYDLFEKFNYLDCSEVPGLNGFHLRLHRTNGVLIDLINMALYFSGRIDVHGAYFWTNSPTFEILKFLMIASDESDEEICQAIERLIANTRIRFLPSQPFLSN